MSNARVCLRFCLRVGALVGALVALSTAQAGTGSLDADAQALDMTVLLLYPPSAADVEAAKHTIRDASALLCDVTEGQIRLGHITLRAGGCESGNCQVGFEEADVVMTSNMASGGGQTTPCTDPEPCIALGSSGFHTSLRRTHLQNPTVWAHEIAHLALGLADAYPAYQCLPHRPPTDELIDCDDLTATHTTLMLAEGCGMASETEYSELTTQATMPATHGQGAPCAAQNTVFAPGGDCAVSSACPDVGGYGAEYDGAWNDDDDKFPICEAFDPDTCRYERSSTEWWSLYKFGEVIDEMQVVARTLEAVNGGDPVFQSVASGVPATGVPANREAFCAVEPVIDDEIDVPDQVMLVLDRSWSMAFPTSQFEKCDPAGCPEICGNGHDDDGDGNFDEEDCAASRIDKVKQFALDYLDLLAAVPEEGIEAGIMSFACTNSLDLALGAVTPTSVEESFAPAVNGLEANGGTAIVDALNSANQQLDGASKAIFLLTDGFTSCGDTDINGAIETLDMSGTRVYATSFGPAIGSAESSEIAAGTHGRFQSAETINHLVPAFARQWASFTQTGLVIPELPYRVFRDSTVPPAPPRTAATWAAGNDSPPAQPSAVNRFDVTVEPGTEKLIVLLADDDEDSEGFGVRAVLNAPPGPGPILFDSQAAAANSHLTIKKRKLYLQLEVTQPNPGLWHLEVSALPGVDIDGVQQGFLTVMARNPRVALSTHIAPSLVTLPGQIVRVGAAAEHVAEHVFEATLTATLIRPDGTATPLTVLGGSEVNDSYRIRIAPPALTQAGLYEVRLLMNATAGVARAKLGEQVPDHLLPISFVRTSSETFMVKNGSLVCPSGSTLDCDGDGVTGESTTFDPDGDGIPDFRDLDSDNDEIEDAFEYGPVSPDHDGDGTPNADDRDADGDGVVDSSDPGVDPAAHHHRVLLRGTEVGSCGASGSVSVAVSSDEPVLRIAVPLQVPATAPVHIVGAQLGPDVPASSVASLGFTQGPPLLPGLAYATLQMKVASPLAPANGVRALSLGVAPDGFFTGPVSICPIGGPTTPLRLNVVRAGSIATVTPESACGVVSPGAGDSDHDGFDDSCDNCPYDANPSQSDTDVDGRGNACDPTLSACADTLDNDQDGLRDSADPGCQTQGDVSESAPNLVCDNGIDDDGDGRVDLADSECHSPTGTSESAGALQIPILGGAHPLALAIILAIAASLGFARTTRPARRTHPRGR